MTTSITTSDKSDHTTQYFCLRILHLFRWKRATHQGFLDERLQTIVTVDSPHQAAWAAIPWTQGMETLDPTRAAAPSHLRMERFLLTLKKSMFCWSLWSRLFFAILCRLQGWGNPCSDLKKCQPKIMRSSMILLHDCYCIGILEHDSQPSQLQSSTAQRPPLRLGDRRVCPGRQ